MLTGPRIDYPLGGRVDALVARWAHSAPRATALTWQGSAITYLDLCRAAEGERARLAAQGIGPGDIVAVRLSRSPHLVAVLLGVLATGAAYAGGAVDWPRTRFDDVAARCGARAVIDEDTPEAPAADTALRSVAGRPTDPCCVFSTSGSSGHPRAVLTPHSGTARIALDPLLGMDCATHFLQISPLGWDINSMELWGPLINGGVCALYDDCLPGAQELRRAVAAGVNTVWLTTSLFNALVEDDVHCLDGLRCVLTGGEKISPRHVAMLRAELPHLRLVNGYGPVESTVLATGYEIPEVVDAAGDIPIGHPLANTQVLVQDGEIVLAGDGLGTGYLGDPEATAQRFRPEGYHTGDLGRVDEDGVIWFAGRADRELKIRGARIAPEEVEGVMDALPGVHRSVLLAAANGTETAGFYLGGADPDTVRSHLAQRFPAAFVPRVLRSLESMPTKPNGKLDTAALLAAATPAPAVRGSAVPDRTDPAAEVVRVATELLGFAVDRDTDLVDAGGNSITTIRLAGRLRIGADIVLTHRTPAAIAAAAAARPRPVAAATPDPSRWVANLPITQYRMWWSEEFHLGAADVIDALMFRIAGQLDTGALAAAVRAVTARHEALHTVLRKESNRHIAALPVADPPECDVVAFHPEAVAEFRAARFDLTAEPPIRARIFRVDDADHLLVVTVHHVAFDGWSESILCRDLSAAYTGAQLPAAAGFRAVAWEQVTTAAAPDGFWREHLRGVPDLPLGPTTPGTGPVTEHTVALEPATTAEWLTAWVQALRAETGATDFAVRMPLAGRALAEADEVVGCFATSAVLRFPSDVRGFDDGVAHATRLLERVIADQHVPLEQIVAEHPPTGRNPLCQAVFSLQNTDRAVLALPGATVRRVRTPQPDSALAVGLEIDPAEQRAVLWHRADALTAEQALRMAEHWQAMLRSRREVAV